MIRTIFWCVAALVLSTSAWAQSLVPLDTTSEEAPPVLTEQLTESEAQALVSRLSDSEVREILLNQLAAQAEERDGILMRSSPSEPVLPISGVQINCT